MEKEEDGVTSRAQTKMICFQPGGGKSGHGGYFIITESETERNVLTDMVNTNN